MFVINPSSGAVVAAQSSFALSDKLASPSYSDCHFSSVGTHHLCYEALELSTTNRRTQMHALGVCSEEPLSPRALGQAPMSPTAGVSRDVDRGRQSGRGSPACGKADPDASGDSGSLSTHVGILRLISIRNLMGKCIFQSTS